MREEWNIRGNDLWPPLEMYEEVGKTNLAFCNDNHAATLSRNIQQWY